MQRTRISSSSKTHKGQQTTPASHTATVKPSTEAPGVPAPQGRQRALPRINRTQGQRAKARVKQDLSQELSQPLTRSRGGITTRNPSPALPTRAPQRASQRPPVKQLRTVSARQTVDNAQVQAPSPYATLLEQLMVVNSATDLDRVVQSPLARSVMQFDDRVEAESTPLNRLSAVRSVEELDKLLGLEAPQDR
ncbi:hypothetical protein [uncultured Hydrogenophaga sp.]|uniref:hypothetical protein n=1 Tax=uncultured Hydrogenophaga sp. TaxID=199683 RepID=UPI00258520E8|nr:hypothetical protein [uncultured Hydrogenophaga sp.]